MVAGRSLPPARRSKWRRPKGPGLDNIWPRFLVCGPAVESMPERWLGSKSLRVFVARHLPCTPAKSFAGIPAWSLGRCIKNPPDGGFFCGVGPRSLLNAVSQRLGAGEPSRSQPPAASARPGSAASPTSPPAPATALWWVRGRLGRPTHCRRHRSHPPG